MSEKKKESATELKEKMKKARAEAMESYNTELMAFLKERDIDLSAHVISSTQGNQVQVFIVDKL